MPLVSEVEETRQIYQEAGERGLALGCFCTENQRTPEAILQATYQLGQELDCPDLPVVVGFTAGYAGRSNASHYTSLEDNLLGTQALVDDLRLLLSARSRYRQLRVMLHLDHGHPQRDAEVMGKHLDVLASVMYDASEFPLAENMERTARFAAKHRAQVLTEGAVDEIYESGSGAEKNELTDPQTAARYLAETGVDLLVPNVGTEHRATVTGAHYHGERARAIAREVGARLCLHGTSSLSLADVRRLPADGFIKVNVWTVLPRTGAQAVARSVIEHLGNILEGSTIGELQSQGYLGPRYAEPAYAREVCQGALGPKLSHVTEEHLGQVWTEAVVAKLKELLLALGYRRWGRGPTSESSG